jgi:hypothetical protein
MQALRMSRIEKRKLEFLSLRISALQTHKLCSGWRAVLGNFLAFHQVTTSGEHKGPTGNRSFSSPCHRRSVTQLRCPTIADNSLGTSDATLHRARAGSGSLKTSET